MPSWPPTRLRPPWRWARSKDTEGAVTRVRADAAGAPPITDEGRGTDTRVDDQGRTVKKPVMTTKDLRFFDCPQAAVLPDGHPRRGMSVVSALSD